MRKLGVKEGHIVLALGSTPDILARIQEGLPRAAYILDEMPKRAAVDVVLVWPKPGDDLEDMFRLLRNAIVPDGAVWAVISRKRTTAKGTERVTFDQVQAAALRTDLVDNKVVSLSDREYGIRFVIRREKRGFQ